jgi:hypothetical protein
MTTRPHACAAALLAMFAVGAHAQQSAGSTTNKLQYDSTGSYNEHATTTPASATAGASSSNALNTVPGKVSAGKEPATGRPNGLGMDAGASTMSKKP